MTWQKFGDNDWRTSGDGYEAMVWRSLPDRPWYVRVDIRIDQSAELIRYPSSAMPADASREAMQSWCETVIERELPVWRAAWESMQAEEVEA